MKITHKNFEKILHYVTKTVVIPTLVALIVPFAIFMPVPVHAQQAQSNASYQSCMRVPGATSQSCTQAAINETGVGPSTDTVSNTPTTPVLGTTGAATASNPKPASDDFGCGVSTTFNAGVCLANVVYLFTVGLGSGLAYMGAFIFDTTVSLSLNSAAYALSFLSSGWTTARDLANMAFILILVYIAFMIMFQAETARTIQMLAWVIFIALIINFSFFFTRVVIDVSNILAVQFYNSAGVGADGRVHTLAETFNTAATSGGTAGVAASTASTLTGYFGSASTLSNTRDLTYSIMSALNITELFSNSAFKATIQNSSTMSNLIILSTLYIAIGAAYFILAAMFLAVGIKFLVRIVVLWFLIIASPLAFICKAVPKDTVSAWYDKWQHELINHAFYPAFFMFIFFFISTIMAGLNTSGGLLGGLATDLQALSQNQNIGGIIYVMSAVANVGIRLGFVVAMLYIALKASEYMGVKGGQLAHSVTGWATRTGTGAVFGGTGAALRSTIGAGGYALGQSSAVRGAAKTAPGRLLQNTLLGVGRKSFDLRAAPGVRAGLGKIGIDTNEAGGKGGYQQAVKDRIELRKKQQSNLKPSDYVLDKAYAQAIAGLSDADKEELARTSKAYTEAQEAQKNGEATTAEVKAAKAAYKAVADRVQIDKKAKKIAGADYSKEFAANVGKLGWHNLGGLASSGIPGWVSRRDKEAAAVMRESKDDKNRTTNILKSLGYDGSRGAAPTPPVPPTPPPATPPTPAPGGGPVIAPVVLTPGGGPTPPTTPPSSRSTPGGYSGSLILPSDVAPNPLTDAERERRRAQTPPRGPGTPPTTPGGPTPGTPPTPPVGPLPFSLRQSGPTSPISGGPDIPANLSSEEKGLAEDWKKQGLSPAEVAQTVKYMREGEAAGATSSQIPETEKLEREFPKIPTELAEQMKGLREDVSKLQGSMAKPAPQSFVQPPPQQAPWTPKSPAASFSAEQKRQVKDILKETIDAQTEKLGEKFAAIKKDMDRKEDIKTREEWLKGEAKRIMNSVEKGEDLSITQPPPAPPPPPPFENDKKE